MIFYLLFSLNLKVDYWRSGIRVQFGTILELLTDTLMSGIFVILK